MAATYIGLMSGTSVDSLDAVAVQFEPSFKLIACHDQPLPTQLRHDILTLGTPSSDEIVAMAKTDIAFAKLSAVAVNSLLAKAQLTPADICAIGSHGQTIRHLPDLGTSLQIGDGNIIAELTQIDTVADFRRRDMAAGGQGAPLVPAFHQYIFGDSHQDNIILNIGGISNITWLPYQRPTMGFDTGPGNMLLDAWIQRHKGTTYDKDGDWARTGSVDTDLLACLMEHRFIRTPPPKSTGREDFNLMWLDTQLAKRDSLPSAADVQATLLEFTAQSIIANINCFTESHGNPPIYVCGGGAHNSLLMERLQALYPDAAVQTTQALGIDPNWVEAIAFAWLAKQFCDRQTSNVTEVTGASGLRCLGVLYPA